MTRALLTAWSLLLLAGGSCFASELVGCSSPDAAERVNPVAGGPDRAQFAEVAPVLVNRCGSIDCHGSAYRNMRLYGYASARLDPAHTPDDPKTITQAEIDADYDAVVALEPTLMAEVVASGGANAADLTLVRKARGAENHKGGRRIDPGDDADVCLISWLGGNVDVAACRRVVPIAETDAGPSDAGSSDADAAP